MRCKTINYKKFYILLFRLFASLSCSNTGTATIYEGLPPLMAIIHLKVILIGCNSCIVVDCGAFAQLAFTRALERKGKCSVDTV